MDCGKASDTEKEFQSVTVSVTIFKSGMAASAFGIRHSGGLSLPKEPSSQTSQTPESQHLSPRAQARAGRMKRKVKAVAAGAGPYDGMHDVTSNQSDQSDD